MDGSELRLPLRSGDDTDADAMENRPTCGALDGVRVIDATTIAVGPLVAIELAQQGAEVITVARPVAGDSAGPDESGCDTDVERPDAHRSAQRVTLDIRQPEGQELLHELLDVSDVFVVNARSSALARCGLDYRSVHEAHPHVVMLHVSGHRGEESASDRAGSVPVTEAMGELADLVDRPDSSPALPPFMVADGAAALAATSAVVMALYQRDVHHAAGQLVEIDLIEPLARLLEPATLADVQLGATGARSCHLGASNEAVYGDLLGIDEDRLRALESSGII